MLTAQTDLLAPVAFHWLGNFRRPFSTASIGLHNEATRHSHARIHDHRCRRGPPCFSRLVAKIQHFFPGSCCQEHPHVFRHKSRLRASSGCSTVKLVSGRVVQRSFCGSVVQSCAGATAIAGVPALQRPDLSLVPLRALGGCPEQMRRQAHCHDCPK